MTKLQIFSGLFHAVAMIVFAWLSIDFMRMDAEFLSILSALCVGFPIWGMFHLLDWVDETRKIRARLDMIERA